MKTKITLLGVSLIMVSCVPSKQYPEKIKNSFNDVELNNKK